MNFAAFYCRNPWLLPGLRVRMGRRPVVRDQSQKWKCQRWGTEKRFSPFTTRRKSASTWVPSLSFGSITLSAPHFNFQFDRIFFSPKWVFSVAPGTPRVDGSRQFPEIFYCWLVGKPCVGVHFLIVFRHLKGFAAQLVNNDDCGMFCFLRNASNNSSRLSTIR